MIEKTKSVKKFIGAHRVALAVTATAGICLVLNRIALKDHNDFLKEHGLYDAFYNAEDSE